jgi:predicted phage terminase large subunit-like protein
LQDLRRLPEVRGVPFKAVKVDTDKYTRALAWANLAEEGRVYLVQGPWIDDFLDEVCRFTGRGDAHDDQVDAVSLAFGMLRRRGGRSMGC